LSAKKRWKAHVEEEAPPVHTRRTSGRTVPSRAAGSSSRPKAKKPNKAKKAKICDVHDDEAKKPNDICLCYYSGSEYPCVVHGHIGGHLPTFDTLHKLFLLDRVSKGWRLIEHTGIFEKPPFGTSQIKTQRRESLM
jgi:hypothetical protein